MKTIPSQTPVPYKRNSRARNNANVGNAVLLSRGVIGVAFVLFLLVKSVNRSADALQGEYDLYHVS
jgi:hypothetical protein